MPSMTLRDWLDQPNPHLIVDPRINPSVHEVDGVHLDCWKEWEDFNMAEINALLGHLLDRKYNFPVLRPIRPALLVIATEDAMDSVADKWNAEIVNTALETVANGNPTLLWAVGGASQIESDTSMHPDWSAPRSDTTTYSRPSFVAGDSKMLKPGFLEECAPRRGKQFETNLERVQANCLKQVLTYAAELNTRYAYLLSPFELIIIRASSSADIDVPDSESVAATRPRRPPLRSGSSYAPTSPSPASSPPAAVYQSPFPATPRPSRTTSGLPPSPHQSPPPVTPRMLQVSNPSTPTTAGSGSRYTEVSPAKRARTMAPPWVKVVPRNATKGDLTINMTMFVVHLIGGAEWEWKDSYPALSNDPVLRAAVGLPPL